MTKQLQSFLIGMCLWFTTMTTHAVVIDLGKTTGQPASLIDEYNRLVQQIDIYNNSHDNDLLYPVQSSAIKTEIIDGDKNISLDLNNFDGYLLFKWGSEDQFYYANFINEEDSSVTFTSTVFNNNNKTLLGLSHWDRWDVENSVPDTGITLTPFVIGLIGLILIKQKYNLV